MAELLSSVIGLGKSLVVAAKDAYAKHTQQKQELLYDFVLEAIGQEDCLIPDAHQSGTLSLATIELRIRLLQSSERDRANKYGIPAVGSLNRQERIRGILGEMVRAGKLKRCRAADRWQL
jgi:hypothetical protein